MKNIIADIFKIEIRDGYYWVSNGDSSKIGYKTLVEAIF